MDDDDVSLNGNLNRCLLSLRKIQDVYCPPNQIVKNLEYIETKLRQCMNFCESSQETAATYPTVLKLLTDTICCDSKLRLFFINSPYWEHFQRNLREISQVLKKCCDHHDVIYRRKFVSMDQITRSRCWGSMKYRTASFPVLQSAVQLQLASDVQLQPVEKAKSSEIVNKSNKIMDKSKEPVKDYSNVKAEQNESHEIMNKFNDIMNKSDNIMAKSNEFLTKASDIATINRNMSYQKAIQFLNV